MKITQTTNGLTLEVNKTEAIHIQRALDKFETTPLYNLDRALTGKMSTLLEGYI